VSSFSDSRWFSLLPRSLLAFFLAPFTPLSPPVLQLCFVSQREPPCVGPVLFALKVAAPADSFQSMVV